MKRLAITLAALSFFGALTTSAQTKTLTLEDVYVNYTYRAKGVNLAWSDNGNTFLSRNGSDIIETDAINGKTSVIASIPVACQGYEWSDDRTKMLLTTDSKRVWRRNTKAQYSVFDIKSGKVYDLAKGFEHNEMMFTKLSPAGDKAAYLYKNNLYIEDVVSGKITPLTKDGGKYIVNGTTDWVYEEELELSDGFRWSPDGKYIAFWQFDTEGTGEFSMINNLDSNYSQVITLPYPKVGEQNSAVKVGRVNVETGEIRWFDVPGDPRNNYLARMDFLPGSNTVMIQQLNRLQNTNTVWYGNVETMGLEKVYEDHDDAFLNVYQVRWIDNGANFLWTSEKDGWRHIYKVSRDCKSEILITRGDFDVISVAGMDTKGGWLYYYATDPDDAVHQYLYRSRLDGKKATERVTPVGNEGVHRYQISANCKYAIHSWSNANTPSTYELISLPDHKTVRILEDNADYKAQMAQLGFPAKEYVKVDTGDIVLDAWILKPKGFDPSKKYPVIFHVYGEPASSTVTDSWSGDQWSRVLNENGYVVMSVDPRGTNNPRGREWRKSIYRQVGILAISDHAKAVRKLEQMFSWIDADRIGIWGWSGGGASTANLMFKYPDVYKTGIAVAGVYNQLLYDNVYQERYMGLPSENVEGFRYGSPINSAAGLQGNLMIIHGTGDDNVHYQNADQLIDELVRLGKPFSMMAYPMRTHGISERPGTTIHLYRTMLDYWLKNLPAGAR